MGLCKCERKKVTSLFCFEHRVNVCEFCLVTDHPKCIVQSYLQWLNNSEYDPSCYLCKQPLDGAEDCVRLICMDVFHWKCLNNFAAKLPQTTAPAGYECPKCRQCIFPQHNQGGPVAESLRRCLSTASWAESAFYGTRNDTIAPISNSTNFTAAGGTNPTSVALPTEGNNSVYGQYAKYQQNDSREDFSLHSNLQVGEQAIKHDHSLPHYNSTENYQQSFKNSLVDEEDKYKRRSAFLWLARLIKSNAPSSFSQLSRRRRIFIVLLLAFLAIFTFLRILHTFSPTDDAIGDPLLDPMMNPNIHIEEPLKRRRIGAEVEPQKQAGAVVNLMNNQ